MPLFIWPVSTTAIFLFHHCNSCAGPIVTFNSYMHYINTPVKLKGSHFSELTSFIILKAIAIRFVEVRLTMANLLSFNWNRIALFPCFRFGLVRYIQYRQHLISLIVIVAGLFWKLSPIQLVSCSYILLKLMWLKFLVMWRFFRLWALADGVDPPENMTRCMSNNYSIEMFWKGWHSSINKWIVR